MLVSTLHINRDIIHTSWNEAMTNKVRRKQPADSAATGGGAPLVRSSSGGHLCAGKADPWDWVQAAAHVHFSHKCHPACTQRTLTNTRNWCNTRTEQMSIQFNRKHVYRELGQRAVTGCPAYPPAAALPIFASMGGQSALGAWVLNHDHNSAITVHTECAHLPHSATCVLRWLSSRALH